MISVSGPALAVAFVITLLEMTEVVALVFALSADHATVRPGAYGAVAGTTTVALVALGAGTALLAFPTRYLLWGAAVTLAAFAVFLFRSTLRTYRRARAGTSPPPKDGARAAQFAGGFTVGAVEATEAVVVLLALTAGGAGASAVLGAVAGGAVLVLAALAVHDRIRRIKVPWLKWGATSMVVTFAVFWAGEAAGVTWPGDDLSLLPIFAVAVVAVRGAIELGLRRTSRVPSPGSA